MGIRDDETIRKALDSLRDARGYGYVDEKIMLEDLDALRQRVIESSNQTPVLDAITLVKRMNEQRNQLIDYIIKLETYIKQTSKVKEQSK